MREGISWESPQAIFSICHFWYTKILLLKCISELQIIDKFLKKSRLRRALSNNFIYQETSTRIQISCPPIFQDYQWSICNVVTIMTSRFTLHCAVLMGLDSIMSISSTHHVYDVTVRLGIYPVYLLMSPNVFDETKIIRSALSMRFQRTWKQQNRTRTRRVIPKNPSGGY